MHAPRRKSLMARGMARLGIGTAASELGGVGRDLCRILDNVLVLSGDAALAVSKATGAWGDAHSGTAALVRANEAITRVVSWAEAVEPKGSIAVFDCGLGTCLRWHGGEPPLGKSSTNSSSASASDVLKAPSAVFRTECVVPASCPPQSELTDVSLTALRFLLSGAIAPRRTLAGPATSRATVARPLPPGCQRAVLLLCPSATATAAHVTAITIAIRTIAGPSIGSGAGRVLQSKPNAASVASASLLPLSARPGALPSQGLHMLVPCVRPRAAPFDSGGSCRGGWWRVPRFRRSLATAASAAPAAVRASASTAAAAMVADPATTLGLPPPTSGQSSREASDATDSPPLRAAAIGSVAAVSPRLPALDAAAGAPPPLALPTSTRPLGGAGVAGDGAWLFGPKPPRLAALVMAIGRALRPPEQARQAQLAAFTAAMGEGSKVPLPAANPGRSARAPAEVSMASFVEVAQRISRTGSLSAAGLPDGPSAQSSTEQLVAAYGDDPAVTLATPGSRRAIALFQVHADRTAGRWRRAARRWVAAARGSAAAARDSLALPCSAAPWASSAPVLPVGDTVEVASCALSASESSPPRAPSSAAAPRSCTAVLRWVEISMAPLTSERCVFVPSVTVLDRGPHGGSRILFSSSARSRRCYDAGAGPVMVPVNCLVTGQTTVRVADMAVRWREAPEPGEPPEMVLENNLLAKVVIHTSAVVPTRAATRLAKVQAELLADAESDAEHVCEVPASGSASGSAAASSGASAFDGTADAWATCVTMGRDACGIPPNDGRFPPQFHISLVFSAPPAEGAWSTFPEQVDGALSAESGEDELPRPRVFAVPALEAPVPPQQACVACAEEDCGAVTPVRLGVLQAAAARGADFCSEFGREGSGSELEDEAPAAARALARAVERLRRKGPRVVVPRGSRGRRALDLAPRMPWGDSNSDSDDMAILEEAEGGPPKPGAGGILVDDDAKDKADSSELKVPFAERVRAAVVASFRVGGSAARRISLLENRREDVLMWAGGGGGFPPVWCHCSGCGAAVRVPPSLSVLCGQAEEAIVCAPYEDEREEQETNAADTAATEAHPFEVEASSGAGSGMAVQAMAVAHRRRNNAQLELRRKVLNHFEGVSDADAADAQSLLGTAGGTSEDLVLVVALLAARRKAGIREEPRLKAFDTDSEDEDGEPAAAEAGANPATSLVAGTDAAHPSPDAASGGAERAEESPADAADGPQPESDAIGAAAAASVAAAATHAVEAAPTATLQEPSAGMEDVSVAARLQAGEMRSVGVPEAEVEAFLASHGATGEGSAAAMLLAAAPPGVMGRASNQDRSQGRGRGGESAGRARWPSGSGDRPTVASVARGKPSALQQEARTETTAKAGVSAVAGASTVTARESARIASTVRGTIFGKVSLKGASPEEIDRLRVITVTQRDLDAATAAGDDTEMADSDKDASWRKRGRPTASCIICCDDLEVGDKVRVLPCFHRMHVRCIDPWLLLKASCPVCHETARKGISQEVLNIVKALNGASEQATSQDYGAIIRSTIAALLPRGEAVVDDLLEQYEEISDRICS